MPESDANMRKFRATRWSMVLRARGEGPEASRALEDFCQDYWFPLYAWCRRKGLSASDAEDMVQGFFQKVIEKRLLDHADVQRGKLRTYLLTILNRHINDERKRDLAERRGGGKVISFDGEEAENFYADQQIEGESDEHLYDRQWALTMLNHAVAKLEIYYTDRGKSEQFDAMRRFLNEEGSAEEYVKVGKQLKMTEGSLKIAVHRMRTKFRELLRTEVSIGQPEGVDVDEEIDYLAQVLRSLH
ncbi:RNA polymerase sigma factor [Cerasicoccus frondis]|uniref:RNA polymerase sigma factor n=1 Tax=Cerasicoccus frondis TaxID=490090 RepID=UPI0028525A17|nr:sigma factor [Cerasicoccus frondis]